MLKIFFSIFVPISVVPSNYLHCFSLEPLFVSPISSTFQGTPPSLGLNNGYFLISNHNSKEKRHRSKLWGGQLYLWLPEGSCVCQLLELSVSVGFVPSFVCWLAGSFEWRYVDHFWVAKTKRQRALAARVEAAAAACWP